MLLTFGTCNSPACTAAWEYALRCSRFADWGSVSVRQAGRPRTVRTSASEDAIITAVEREPWSNSRDIARESGLPQPRTSKYCVTISCIHTTARRAPVSFQMIGIYGRSFANGCDISALRMSPFYKTFSGQTKHVLRVRMSSTSTTLTSGQWITFKLRANVSMVSTSASVFGL